MLSPGDPLLAYVQDVVDALPFYVMLVDAGHHILLANAAVRDALRVDPSALLGGYCPKLVHGLSAPFRGCPLEEAVRVGGAIEWDHRDPATGRVVLSGAYPTRYTSLDGSSVYLHTVRDITAQREAEAAAARTHEAQKLVNELLRLSLQLDSLEAILEQIAERVVAIPWLAAKPRAVIFLADESGERLILKAQRGLVPSQQLACAALPFGTCVCGRAAATRQIQFDAVADGGRHVAHAEASAHGHYCVPFLSGDTVLGVLSVSVDPGHSFDPSELGFLTTVADVIASIVQRKRAESLQREHERIALSRERMARIGEVSAGVAHTIRNPLHGLINFVELLSSEAANGQVASQEVLGLVLDGLERIEKVTRRLLALTRDQEAELFPTELKSLLGDVFDLMAVPARSKQVSMRVECELAGEVLLDADQVMEGLTCVVSNAIDACQPGGHVTVRAKREGEPARSLVIEVDDDGSGIAEELLPRVIDPFFSTKPVGEGSGLGLAITRRVMDQHGGDLEITSKVGVGTRVRLLFRHALSGPGRDREPEGR